MNMRRKDREVHDIETVKEILDSCKTCHVAMVDGTIPYVVPLSYGYDLENSVLTLYFHSAKEGRKKDILKVNPNVCFNLIREGEPLFAETPCNSGYYFSSIIGDGIVKIIENASEKKYALSKMFYQQSGRQIEFTDAQADTVCVYKIVCNDFSAKKKNKPS